MTKKKYNNIIIITLDILFLLLFFFFILYRFRTRMPRDIFTDVTLVIGISYVIVFGINLILCYKLYLEYHKKNMKNPSIITQIGLDFYEKIEESFARIIDIIVNLKSPIDILLAKITHYYLKIPLIILLIIEYMPRLLLIVALYVDVFYLECFYYSYIFIYPLLFTFLSRSVLYLSIEINLRISNDLKKCITIVNYENVLKTIYGDPLSSAFNINDYKLSEYNTQCSSIEEALSLFSLVSSELEILYKIRDHIKTSWFFVLFIRCCYIIIFGYILYFIPLHTIKIIFSFLFKFFIVYFKINIIFIFTIMFLVYYLLYKK